MGPLLKPGAVFLAVPLCAWVAGCGSSPTTPSGGAARYEGQWSGITSQGTPISFTVSADEKVTSISVGYSFNGCSGTHTFSNLNLETAPSVTCIPGPCPAPVSAYRAFSFSSGSLDAGMTSVHGIFPATVRAEGAVGFMNYPVCGTALGVGWSATRR